MSKRWLRLSGLPEARLIALRFRYAEPWRHYHVWEHVEALFADLTPAEDRLNDSQAVALAVLYHDAVYDPRSARNERYSAELMEAECAGHVAGDSVGAAAAMIRATEGHTLPDGLGERLASDMALFLDADLAILAAEPETFDAYEAAVRREYAHVPEADFRKGRAAVLQRFLDRPRLFFSALFHDTREARARDNLHRSLQKLR